MSGRFSENAFGRVPQHQPQENVAQFPSLSQLQFDLGGQFTANDRWQVRAPGDCAQALSQLQFDLDWHFLPTNRLHAQSHGHHAHRQSEHDQYGQCLPTDGQAQTPSNNAYTQSQLDQYGQCLPTDRQAQTPSNNAYAQSQLDQYGQCLPTDRAAQTPSGNASEHPHYHQHGQFNATEHHPHAHNDAYAQSQFDPYRQAERHPQTQCDKTSPASQLDFDSDWQFKATDYQTQWRPHKDKLPQDVAELEFDTQGRITSMTTQDRVKYEYSKFGDDGQPRDCKITDRKTGDWGQWKQESEGIWRSYNKNHPNYEILRGRWTVDSHGRMHMEGVQDAAPLPLVSNDGVLRTTPAHSETHQDSIHHVYTNRPSPYLPKGYHTVTRPLPPEAVSAARSLLGGDYGTETPFNVDGRHFLPA